MSHKSFTAALFWFSFSAIIGVGATAHSQQAVPAAADLQISPRFDIDLNTSRSGDRKSFGQVGGFFPLFQKAGNHLTYGSVENPFTMLGSSQADADNTGLRAVEAGEVVYVRAGDSRVSAIAPFTIPAGVQVYSEATSTTLPTQLGDISLPGSGTGIRPLVSGADGITLAGGNNRVSGFEIDGATNGITITNPIGDVTIENNLISNATNRAISLAQSSDAANISITNNSIETAANDGIRVELTETANLNLSINNNQISNVTNADGDGIDIEANNRQSGGDRHRQQQHRPRW